MGRCLMQSCAELDSAMGKKIADKEKARKVICDSCGFYSEEDERRRALPLKPDEDGLHRKMVAKEKRNMEGCPPNMSEIGCPEFDCGKCWAIWKHIKEARGK